MRALQPGDRAEGPGGGVAVAHLGARLHYGVAVQLNALGYLGQLFTDAYTGPGSWLHSFLKALPADGDGSALSRLRQRAAPLPPDKVTAYNGLGLRYYLALRTRPRELTYLRYSRLFARRVTVSRHFTHGRLLYAFSDSALELLTAARSRSIPAVLEQMIAPHAERCRVLREEALRWPAWADDTEQCREGDAWAMRESREWELADRIVAPSQYVVDALRGQHVPEGKIVLLPYGVPAGRFPGTEHTYDGSRPLHVLFVGNVGLRKGVPYLLEAAGKLDRQSLRVRLVGSLNVAAELLKPYSDAVEVVGRVPRESIVEAYRWADVLVMPSLCEGSATVTYEALLCGVPVIATPNSGACIRDGVDGLSVPIRNSDALADALRTFLDSPHMVSRMSLHALERVADLSWDAYGERLAGLVSPFVDGRTGVVGR